jgi:hypothetical protein
MGEAEESELRKDCDDAEDVDHARKELELELSEESVLGELLVLLELLELGDIEVADCEPYGGPLFDDLLDDELLEVLFLTLLDDELLFSVVQVMYAA